MFTINVNQKDAMNQSWIYNNLHNLKNLSLCFAVVVASGMLHTRVASTLEDLLYASVADFCVHLYVTREDLYSI